MLVETDLSVAEIAERLSYSNAQNFIRLFKKTYGYYSWTISETV